MAYLAEVHLASSISSSSSVLLSSLVVVVAVDSAVVVVVDLELNDTSEGMKYMLLAWQCDASGKNDVELNKKNMATGGLEKKCTKRRLHNFWYV